MKKIPKLPKIISGIDSIIKRFRIFIENKYRIMLKAPLFVLFLIMKYPIIAAKKRSIRVLINISLNMISNMADLQSIENSELIFFY